MTAVVSWGTLRDGRLSMVWFMAISTVRAHYDRAGPPYTDLQACQSAGDALVLELVGGHRHVTDGGSLRRIPQNGPYSDT